MQELSNNVHCFITFSCHVKSFFVLFFLSEYRPFNACRACTTFRRHNTLQDFTLWNVGNFGAISGQNSMIAENYAGGPIRFSNSFVILQGVVWMLHWKHSVFKKFPTVSSLRMVNNFKSSTINGHTRQSFHCSNYVTSVPLPSDVESWPQRCLHQRSVYWDSWHKPHCVSSGLGTRKWYWILDCA